MYGKTRWMGAAVVVLAATAMAQGSEDIRSNDPVDVAAIIAFEKSAATATDLDAVVSLFATDAVVADLSAPGWLAGREVIRTALKGQYDAVKVIRPEMKSIDVASNGRYACAAMHVDLDGEMKDGTPLKTSFRELDVFRKEQGGRWSWIQQQVSYPIDPATRRSLTHADWPARQGLTNGGPHFSEPKVGVGKAEAELREWLTARINVADIDKLMALYDVDGGLIVYGPRLPAENRGADEVRAYYGAHFAQISKVDGRISDLRIDTDGGFGAVIGQLSLTVAEKAGGQHSRLYRYNACLRRTDAGWRAFAEMIGAPVDLSTGYPVASVEQMEAASHKGH